MWGKKHEIDVDSFNIKFKECLFNLECVKHGWAIFPSNATEDEKDTAIDTLLDGETPTWYPPGYTLDPVITEGKVFPKVQEG